MIRPYPKNKTGKGLGIKLFTDYLNRDLKENDGKQTVVFSRQGWKGRSTGVYLQPRARQRGGHQARALDVGDRRFGRLVLSQRRGQQDEHSGDGRKRRRRHQQERRRHAECRLAGDGTLPENQAAYLTAFGDFLKINGEGIYGTRPWKTFGEGPLKMKDGRQGENHKDSRRRISASPPKTMFSTPLCWPRRLRTS